MYSSFFILRTRIYLGFILSELICIASGMGAYPEVTDPQSGSGPTKNFESLETEYVLFYTNNKYVLIFILDIF